MAQVNTARQEPRPPIFDVLLFLRLVRRTRQSQQLQAGRAKDGAALLARRGRRASISVI